MQTTSAQRHCCQWRRSSSLSCFITCWSAMCRYNLLREKVWPPDTHKYLHSRLKRESELEDREQKDRTAGVNYNLRHKHSQMRLHTYTRRHSQLEAHTSFPAVISLWSITSTCRVANGKKTVQTFTEVKVLVHFITFLNI